MTTQQGSSVKWLVIGIVVVLVGCLCIVVAVVGGGVLAGLWATNQEGLVPTVSSEEYFDEPTAVPLATVVGPESGTIPDAALETERQLIAADVPVVDLLDLAVRLKGIQNPPRVVAETAAAIPVGTVRTFWASNTDDDTNFQVDAKLAYASDHVYFWVEQGVDYQKRDVENLVKVFEERSYPNNREFFGSEWTPGVDGDVHLYVLFAGNLGDNIAGYYSSSDEYAPMVREYSNAHEMFYINSDTVELGDVFTDSVMAHEFQHMIHWYRDRNEQSWLNEGFSTLSELLNGFDIGGSDYAYAMEPDIPLTYWPSPVEGRHYGQSFLFLAYFLDRFGEEATRALVADAANGLVSIDQVLADLGAQDPDSGQILTADDVYADWAVAAVLNDPSVEDGRFAYDRYAEAPTIELSDEFESCPLTETRTVEQYGLDGIALRCSGDWSVSFEGSTLTQVVPADPHSGDFAFWTNRGDESDMKLTRAFDLTYVSGEVSAEYWLWYDIEEDWDYVYFEVSDDGGETWKILTTPSGTAYNPTGNSYGWGYTGFSGGVDGGEWIQESVDLSAYAGEEILLRFEYITDAAVNGDGLLLDDFSIPALDYATDFESDDEGWQAEGFVRMYNRVPQTYRLMLIEQTRETTVRPIEVDAEQRAEFEISLGGDVDEAILMVIGTSRHTWQPAPYRISLEAQ
ncbi:MAG: immune inhibitor A [Chloroflexi bacterium]|nr:immune inhibitor A [Chloroflexota bacterium]